MEGNAKKLVNTWDIVDTFFRDTEYYKSQHQIDSFNEFIFSKENGIENIIKRLIITNSSPCVYFSRY